jgi:hypothetical protein
MAGHAHPCHGGDTPPSAPNRPGPDATVEPQRDNPGVRAAHDLVGPEGAPTWPMLLIQGQVVRTWEVNVQAFVPAL